MQIQQGVHVVEAKDHEVAIQHVLDVAKRGADAATYTIDTYFRVDVSSGHALLRAIIDAMEIPEWYGYAVDELLAATVASGSRTHTSHLIVIVLRPDLRVLVRDARLIGLLAHAHQLARHRRQDLNTLIFMSPITLLKPRV